MTMDRRKFFAALAAAPVALPVIVKAASERALASGGMLAHFEPGVMGEVFLGLDAGMMTRHDVMTRFGISADDVLADCARTTYEVRVCGIGPVLIPAADDVEGQMRADDIFEEATP
jgi:hypothetical protein